MRKSHRGFRSARLRLLAGGRVPASSLLDVAAESHPAAPVVTPEQPLAYPGLPATGITPQDALSFVARTAEALAMAGVGRGARVAIYKRNAIDYVLLSLAIIRAGGVAVPVNPGMELSVLERYLLRTGCAFLCTDSHTYGHRIGDPERLPAIEGWVFTDRAPSGFEPRLEIAAEIATLSGGRAPAELRPDTPVVFAHTSGTTGTPKAVVSTSGSFVAGIRTHFLSEPPLPGQRVGLAGPFSHLVYQIGLTTLFLLGAPTWSSEAAEPAAAFELLARARPNVFVAFPHLYLQMYAMGLKGRGLDSVRIWVSVADSSQEAHMDAFCKHGAGIELAGRRIGTSIFVEPLGSTEMGGPALRRFWTPAARTRQKRHIGRPLWGGPRVKVASFEGGAARPGEAGRLMVKGSTVFAGYRGGTDNAAPGLRPDGWWATGDVVRRDRWGRYFHLDREADAVTTRCGPFYTLPAEDVLHAHPGVFEAVVYGVADGGGFEQPVGCVWIDPAAELDLDRLRRWANQRLAGPMGLAALTEVGPDDIPRGLTGKVLKRSLRERYERQPGPAMVGRGDDG